MTGMTSPYHEQLANRRTETLARIFDAAEAIMNSGAELTAGAVADAVGIKRNSLYRYIDSIEDLRAGVVARHFPAWIAAVREAVGAARTGPAGAERGVRATAAFVEANLRQATLSGHGWLMQLGAGIRRTQLEGESGGHAALDELLSELVAEALPVAGAGALPEAGAERRAIVAALIRGIILTGFTLIDQGGGATVIEESVRATRAILTS